MTNIEGSVSDASLHEVQRATAGDQRTLADFGGAEGPTYVAVTSSEPDGADCDEHRPELAPAPDLLQEFLSDRDYLQHEAGYSKTYAHNLAWDRVDYAERYRDALWAADDVRPESDALVDLGERIVDGEHIVLVCYCKGAKACHRRILYEELAEWVSIYVGLSDDVADVDPSPRPTRGARQQTLDELGDGE